MKPIDRYFEKARQRPGLASKDEIHQMIRQPAVAESNRSGYREIRKLAAVITIIFLIGFILFLIRPEVTPPVQQAHFTDYYEFRYASLVHELQEHPEKSGIRLIASKAPDIPLHLTAQVQPPEEILNQLGLYTSEKNIVYKGNIQSAGFVSFSIVGERHSVYVADRQQTGEKIYDFYPLFLSDMNGRQRVKYRFVNEPEDKLTDDFFEERINTLIPIVLDVPGTDAKVVFWFLPTEELLNILEQDVSHPVKDRSDFSENQIGREVKIYPNPATGLLNLEMDLYHERINITLLDINGKLVRALMPSTRVIASHGQYQFDTGDIPRGIYLLSIESDQTGRVVRRIIIAD